MQAINNLCVLFRVHYTDAGTIQQTPVCFIITLTFNYKLLLQVNNHHYKYLKSNTYPGHVSHTVSSQCSVTKYCSFALHTPTYTRYKKVY